MAKSNSKAKAPDNIDIVADANYNTISEEYNRALRSWRSNEENEYVFRCRRTAKEHTYVEGVGYHSPDPAAEERRALLRICMVIGLSILIYLLLENLFVYILVTAVKAFGIDVGYSYSDNAVYGPEIAVLGILMLQTFIKYLVPILIFHKTFRMPRRVAFHLKPDVPREFPISVSVTLIVFAAINMWTLFSPTNLLSSSTLGTAYYAVSYMQPKYQIIYLAYETIMVSVLSELLLHGEMFHVLRQFGDWFAILLTAVISACVTHSIVTVLMDLTFATVVGISVLRSGSLLPAFVDRILFHTLLFVFFWLRLLPYENSNEIRTFLMLLLLFAGILGCILLIRPTKSNPALLTQKHYLSGKERIETIIHASPLFIIFLLCLALMLIEVIF